MKRFELSTLSLARRCSTTELHPHYDAWAVRVASCKACNTEGPWVKRESQKPNIGNSETALGLGQEELPGLMTAQTGGLKRESPTEVWILDELLAFAPLLVSQRT